MKRLDYSVVTKVTRWSNTHPVYYNEGYEDQHRQLLRWMQTNFGKPYGRWHTVLDEHGHIVVHVDTESAATLVALRWS